MRIGEYWVAEILGDDSDDIWLFLLAAKATSDRKRCVLGIKCDWETRRPLIGPDATQAFWFYESGDALNDDAPFCLSYRARGHGLRFLNPRVPAPENI